MSTEQLTRAAIALPADERRALMNALRDSLRDEPQDDNGPHPPDSTEPRPDADAFYAELRRADEELRSGKVKGHTLEESMAIVRKAISCD